jgi:hypothetical protein
MTLLLDLMRWMQYIPTFFFLSFVPKGYLAWLALHGWCGGGALGYRGWSEDNNIRYQTSSSYIGTGAWWYSGSLSSFFSVSTDKPGHLLLLLVFWHCRLFFTGIYEDEDRAAGSVAG